MEASTEAPTREVVDVLVRVLGIEDRRDTIGVETGLLGELPELDSLAVVELAVALEERFDIVIDDDDFTGEVFDNVGTLVAFIEARTQGS
ncbi:MAG TPA: acyl carrier protein [Nocardioides sp.]|nr:acyl carrier protein [Nocardioides sp.]